jgi:hypothetical protein
VLGLVFWGYKLENNLSKIILSCGKLYIIILTSIFSLEQLHLQRVATYLVIIDVLFAKISLGTIQAEIRILKVSNI